MSPDFQSAGSARTDHAAPAGTPNAAHVRHLPGAVCDVTSAVTALDPLPLRDGSVTLARLVALYMAHYDGRDRCRAQRLQKWVDALGHVTLAELSDDHVHVELERLASRNATYYAGRDADGRRVFHEKRHRLAPSTLNRYLNGLAAVITWAIRRRIAPKGYVHPCRSVERRPEGAGRTRFLTDAERERLLAACRADSWPKLYGLVLMALTTGARKSELTGLTWADVDLERREASVGRTKNGDPRVLPLVAGVVAELQGYARGKPADLVFGSPRDAARAFSFEAHFVEAVKRARLGRDVTFHVLRHSCASLLAKNGATLLEIADVLGHRQLQVTKRYSHLTTSHKTALVERVLGGIQ